MSKCDLCMLGFISTIFIVRTMLLFMIDIIDLRSIFVLYPHCFMKLPLLIESRTFTLHIFMSVCHKNINNTVYLFTVSFRMAEDVVGPRGRVVEGADSKTLNLASVRRPDGTIC